MSDGPIEVVRGANAKPAAASVEAGMRRRSRERWGLVFGLAAATIWGGYLAITHHGVDVGLTAADLAFLRYAMAALVMLPWLASHQPMSLAGIGWARGSTLALLAGPPFVLAGASGFLYAPLAHSAVIQLGSMPLIGIALAAILVGERPNRRRILGMCTIFAGLALTTGPSLFEGGSLVWIGDLLFASAGCMWALFTVLQRRWQVDPIAATAVVSVLSGVVYAPLYLAWRGWGPLLQMDPLTLLMQALMLGVLTGVVALFVFARAVRYLGPSRASTFPAFAPAIAILLGIPISGEAPNAWQIAGLAVLSIGLIVALPAHPSPSKK